MARIETLDIADQLLHRDATGGLHYEPGLFTKNVQVHLLPLLGLVQGKTASLTGEDTYALVLGESHQVIAVNVGYNQPEHYALLDYSQYEKLNSEVERINFWVALTGQTTWPLVKFTLYEGDDKQLDRSIFTGFKVNSGKPMIGHYHYSTIDLARIEKILYDAGVFVPHLSSAVLTGEKNFAVSA